MWAIAVALLWLQASDPASDGLKALEDGKYETAAAAFSQAVAADPKDYFSHFNLALAYTFLRRDEEALAEYRKTLDLKPGLYEAQLNAGIVLLRRNLAEDALPLLEAAAAQKPGELQPRFHLARAHLLTGSAARAAEGFRAALQLDPKSAEANLGLGRALAMDDKLEEAAPYFRRAGELDASYRDALLELAELYEKKKQPAGAIAIYREFPGNAAAQARMGELLIESKQYGDAVRRLEEAYGKDQTDANRIALAEAYILNQENAKALPLLEQAVAARPSTFELRMAYGRALRDARQFPAAIEQFREAAKLKPGERSAWSEMAAACYMAGDFQTSLAALDQALQLGDNTAGHWFLRAIILDKYRQQKPALDAYQQFLSMSQGKNPDQEFQARQRARIIQKELEKR